MLTVTERSVTFSKFGGELSSMEGIEADTYDPICSGGCISNRELGIYYFKFQIDKNSRTLLMLN